MIKHLTKPLIILTIAAGIGPVALWVPPAVGQIPTLGDSGDQQLRPFAIGFLREGSDFQNAPSLMEELRQYLRGHRVVQEAMRRAHYGEIALSPCDGPRDMIPRIDQREFHLVFATAVIYARHQLPIYLEGSGQPAYVPILQTQRNGDFQPQGGKGGVLRRGVVFAGPDSPLFDSNPPPGREDFEFLANQPLAVPYNFSIAGYIYPRAQLKRKAEEYGLAPPIFRFCGSDEEVVKHVVSGLLPVGACRQGALMSLLPEVKDQGEENNPYFRILMKTTPYPTDPILLLDDLSPDISDLGRELKAALRSFFIKRESQWVGSDMRVRDAATRHFESLVGELAKIEHSRSNISNGDSMVSPAEPATQKGEDEDLKPESTPSPTASLQSSEVTPEPSPTESPTPKPRPLPALPDSLSLGRGASPAVVEAAGQVQGKAS